MSPRSESRENGKQGLSAFCAEFGVTEEELGQVIRLGRRCFLVDESNRGLLELQQTLQEKKADLFSIGVYLGEEKTRFEPSPACVELIAAKTKEHKAVVDEKAAWLFLCGRDLFEKAILSGGEPTESGYILVQNENDENLGYGILAKRLRKRQKNIAIKTLLDRGFYLRRERFA